jgi:hypothetical protein
MPTLLPKDMDNQPIPALRLKSGSAHQISASVSTARNTNAFDEDTRVIGFYADVPVYAAFGKADITASSSDHYIPAGLYYDFAIGGDKTGHATHVAVLAADSDGTVYISEKE